MQLIHPRTKKLRTLYQRRECRSCFILPLDKAADLTEIQATCVGIQRDIFLVEVDIGADLHTTGRIAFAFQNRVLAYDTAAVFVETFRIVLIGNEGLLAVDEGTYHLVTGYHLGLRQGLLTGGA